MTEHVETLVIGAGIAGLAYAHARGPDADLLLLEAGRRAGGLIATLTTPSGHVELGPEALQDNAPETLALLGELGLRPLLSREEAAQRFVMDERGELVALPMNPPAFLKSPLLSWPAKLRALTEPFRRRGVALEGSVAELLTHRLGAQLVERFVDPFVSGIYAGDAELISARACFPAVVEMIEQHGSIFAGMKAKAKARKAAGEARRVPALLSVEGGLERIPEAIAAELGSRLRLECGVEALERTAAGWRAEAGGLVVEAERLVIATSGPMAGALLEKAAPTLSQELASLHAESVVSFAQLWRREELSHPLDGFGYLVRSSLGKRHLGTLFSSSIVDGRCDPHHVLVRTLLGGARRPELAEASDDTLREIITEEVAPTLGAHPEALPDWHHIIRWQSVLPRYDLQHPRRQAAIEREEERVGNMHLLGNHRRGVAVNALIAHSRELARAHAAGVGAAGSGEASRGA